MSWAKRCVSTALRAYRGLLGDLQIRGLSLGPKIWIVCPIPEVSKGVRDALCVLPTSAVSTYVFGKVVTAGVRLNMANAHGWLISIVLHGFEKEDRVVDRPCRARQTDKTEEQHSLGRRLRPKYTSAVLLDRVSLQASELALRKVNSPKIKVSLDQKRPGVSGDISL